MFGVGLVLEPLTYELAKQLGPEVLSHCFTEKKAIHDLMSEVTINVDQPEQCLTVRMAEDVEEHCKLRQVRIRRIKITKRDTSDGSGRKSKKVAPQQPTLRATLECLIDSAEKVHQKFLCDFFAKTMMFSFDPEQEDLFTHAHDEDEDTGDVEEQPELRDTEADDDVLDEQPTRQRKTKAKPAGKSKKKAKK